MCKHLMPTKIKSASKHNQVNPIICNRTTVYMNFYPISCVISNSEPRLNIINILHVSHHIKMLKHAVNVQCTI